MIKTKGFDIEVLPKLYAPTLPKDVIIEYEHDVEQQLLEPLLNSMGWYETKTSSGSYQSKQGEDIGYSQIMRYIMAINQMRKGQKC